MGECGVADLQRDVAARGGYRAADAAPSRSYAKGQPVSDRNPKVLRKESAWIRNSGLENSRSLAEHLTSLADFVATKSAALKALRAVCKIDLFCGFASEHGQGGTTLDRALLSRLTGLGLDLTLDLYPPGGEDAGTNAGAAR